MLLMFVAACNQQAQSDKQFVADVSPADEKASIKKTAVKFQTVKPHAAILMQYEFLNLVKLNEALDLKLNFNVGYDVESLRVKLYPSTGLSVINTQTEFLFNKVSKSSHQTLQLSIMPTQFGEHVLVVSATLEASGGSQSRSFEIPVNVYAKGVQKSQKAKNRQGMKFMPDHNVISMPATETTQ